MRRRVAGTIRVTGGLPRDIALFWRPLQQPRAGALQTERLQLDPATLPIALVARFGELDAFGAFEEGRRKRRVLGNMAQEQLPAGSVAVFKGQHVRHLLPLLVEIHLLRLLGAEERPWRGDERLHEATMQAGNRRAQRAVDLDLQQVVTLDAARPRRADLRQNTALQLEHREGVILDIDLVGLATLFDPARLRGRMAARDGADRAEQAVEDVAPMRKHIEDQAAAGRLLVIPARALRREEIAIEYPPAEIEPDRQHAAEEIRVIEFAELFEAGQEQFVLHDAALPAGALGGARQGERVFQIFGDRLFEINVFAGSECGTGTIGAAAGRGRIEIDIDRRVGEACVAIDAPAQTAAFVGQRGELVAVAPEQQGLRHQTVAVFERQTALAADVEQRAQMLGGAETAGRAVDDDADCAISHRSPFRFFTTETQRAQRWKSLSASRRKPGSTFQLPSSRQVGPGFRRNADFCCLSSVSSLVSFLLH